MNADILIVDDDPAMIQVAARILSGVATLRFATHGERALRLARERQPDLVLLDAEMPGMSGQQVCQAMKADPVLGDIPIIFVTSHSGTEMEIAGLALGAGRLLGVRLGGDQQRALVARGGLQSRRGRHDVLGRQHHRTVAG